MSKRRGLSLEEKKSKMLQLFYEKKEFFQLKELEKLAPKKGITVQSVKDVVQSLVDDGLVDSDKIGTSIYYWSFPSKALHTKKLKLTKLKEKKATLQKSLKECQEKLKEAKVGKEDTSERTKALAENARLKVEKSKLEKELEISKQNNHEVYEQLINDAAILKDAVNRWTDNIFNVRSWCKKNLFIEEDAINKAFGIPEDLDYMD